MKTLVYIIPGLNCEDASNPPGWVTDLRQRLASDDVVVANASYTNASLPEEIAQAIASIGDVKLVLIGHSDGGACIAWLQDHVRRLGPAIIIDLAIFLDPVTDMARHGFLHSLDHAIVLSAVRIYQTADPFIHSNAVSYDCGAYAVQDLTMDKFGAPHAKHTDVPENKAVQDYIASRIASLTSPPAAT